MEADLQIPTAADAIRCGITDENGRPVHPELLGAVIGVEVARLLVFGVLESSVAQRLSGPLPEDPSAAAGLLAEWARRIPRHPSWSALLSAFSQNIRSPADVQVTQMFLRRVMLAISLASVGKRRWF